MINDNKLEDIRISLEQHIKELELKGNPPELYDPITYLMGLGGKRIRPLLTLLAYGLYKEDYQKVLTPAAAIEVFHNFTLMHDDIMDNAPLRRGKATVHEKWDDNTSKTAAEVCEGQQMDMNFENREFVSEAEYLNMIRLKTAVLLGFSLQLGAVLAGASKEDSNHLYDFGVNIGVAFQLKDDLLDVYADKEKFGKQVGGDILANKKTYLLVKANELAEGSVNENLQKWINSTSFNPEEKVKAVTSIYDQLQIKEKTLELMDDYFERGFNQLSSLQVKNTAGLQLLQNLTHNLANREK